MFDKYVIFDFDEEHEKVYWCKNNGVKFHYWSKYDGPERRIKGLKVFMSMLLGAMKAEGVNAYLEKVE